MCLHKIAIATFPTQPNPKVDRNWKEGQGRNSGDM